LDVLVFTNSSALLYLLHDGKMGNSNAPSLASICYCYFCVEGLMPLSEIRSGDRFFERSVIFSHEHIATSDPYFVAHMLVVDTTEGQVSENTLTQVGEGRFSREDLGTRLLGDRAA
jgi:hypothetical protein